MFCRVNYTQSQKQTEDELLKKVQEVMMSREQAGQAFYSSDIEFDKKSVDKKV